MDTILYGKIYTMDRENPYVEAVGIKDGKIAYAGSDCLYVPATALDLVSR